MEVIRAGAAGIRSKVGTRLAVLAPTSLAVVGAGIDQPERSRQPRARSRRARTFVAVLSASSVLVVATGLVTTTAGAASPMPRAISGSSGVGATPGSSGDGATSGSSGTSSNPTGVIGATSGASEVSGTHPQVASSAPSTPVQLAYQPLAPQRIADTRCSTTPTPSYCAAEALPSANATLPTLEPGHSMTVAMPSTVPADAGAVVLNVTAVDQRAAGFLTLWPAGTAMPAVSNVNFSPSQAGFGVSNLVTVGLGTSGTSLAVSVADGPSSGGSVNVVVDLQGYYAPPAPATSTSTTSTSTTPATTTSTSTSPAPAIPGAFVAQSPARIADSRCTGSSPPAFCSTEHLPAANSGFVTLGPGATDTLVVAGVGSVPTSGVEAAILNVTATNTTAASFLSIYPGTTRPEISNLDWRKGETLSNNVLVDLSSSGTVTVYNDNGAVDVVVDVEGWFTNASSTAVGSLLTPLSPARMADTRCATTPAPAFCSAEDLPSANADAAAPAGGGWSTVVIAGNDGVPSSATGAVLNVTDVQPASGNFLTVYPAGASAPVASNVNWVPTDPYDVVPNAAYADLGSGGAVDVRNGPDYAKPTNVLVDLFGFFAPLLDTASISATPAGTGTLDGAVSTITTTLSALGLPVAGVPVVLSMLPSTAGACGTLSPTSGVTDAAGQFLSTYTASAVSGVCTVTSLLDGLLETTEIVQGSGSGSGSASADRVSVTASPTSITVGLLTTLAPSTITATVTDSAGAPVAGDDVTFVASCGTLSSASVPTSSTGQASTSFSATGIVVAETCTVTATEADTGASGSTTVTILL